MSSFTGATRRCRVTNATTGQLLGLAALLFAATAAGHDHHEDEIEEGEIVSSDPIVSVKFFFSMDKTKHVDPMSINQYNTPINDTSIICS